MIVPQVRPSISHFGKFQCISLEPKILRKRWFAWAFCNTFSFVLSLSHDSEHTKLITSLVINLLLAVLYQQSLPWGGLNKFQGDPDSSSSGHFTLCPPRPVSSAYFFCEASWGPPPWFSSFSVRLQPRQLLLTVCFWMFALSAAWPVLHTGGQ